MTTKTEQLIGKKVRVTIENDVTTSKKSLRERLAKALFLLEQKYWDDQFKQHNKADGLLGNVKITYRTRTWEKLAQKHKMYYYDQADTVLDLMKEKQ